MPPTTDLKTADILNVTVPVATFFLGVFFTMFLEKRKRNRKKIETYATETSGLVNDWYNQIYQLNIDAAFLKDDEELLKNTQWYGQNRIVLPKLLQNIEILKAFPACMALVKEVQEFLEMVTEKDTIDEGLHSDLPVFYQNRHVPVSYTCRPVNSLLVNDSFIRKLDRTIQHINIESGKLLRR